MEGSDSYFDYLDFSSGLLYFLRTYILFYFDNYFLRSLLS